MNVNGEKKNSGVLNIHAENECLDSELHLTINVGTINIYSGNDSGQTYAVFGFAQKQNGTDTVCLKIDSGKHSVRALPPEWIFHFDLRQPNLKEGAHTLWGGDLQDRNLREAKTCRRDPTDPMAATGIRIEMREALRY